MIAASHPGSVSGRVPPSLICLSSELFIPASWMIIAQIPGFWTRRLGLRKDIKDLKVNNIKFVWAGLLFSDCPSIA